MVLIIISFVINIAAWFKTKANITLLGEPTKFNTNE